MNVKKNRFQSFLHSKIYQIPAHDFFCKFVVVYFLYLCFRFFDFEPTVYNSLNTVFWKAPGLFSFIGMNAPSAELLIFSKWMGFFSSLAAAVGIAWRFTSSLGMICWALVEYSQNGLGFINVEIHLFWIGLVLCFCPLSSADRKRCGESSIESFAFIFIQLVIVMAYIQSGFSKLYLSGIKWVEEGTTLQFALLRQGQALGVWLSQFAWFCRVGSFLSVVLELSFIFYAFFPRIRVLLLLATFFFHILTFFLLGISFHHLWIASLSLVIFARPLIKGQNAHFQKRIAL